MPPGELQVEHIARLARLRLSPQETAKFSRELAVIVSYFEQLQAVDTSAVTLHQQNVPAANVFREDMVVESLPRDKALANAPKSNGEYFLVPKVIG